MVYRRAVWPTPPGQAAAAPTLQTRVTRALQAYPDIVTSRWPRADGPVVEIRQRRSSARAVHLHIVSYIPDDEAATVPIAQGGDSAADLTTAEAPDGEEFLRSDVALRISGDHVILCGWRFPNQLVEGYLKALIHRSANGAAGATAFQLHPVANQRVLTTIRNQGVSRVELDVISYRESLTGLARTSLKRRVPDAIMDFVYALIGQDATRQQLEEAENIQAQLVISFDGRKKDADLAAAHMTAFTRDLLEDQPAGYTIVTRDGQRIVDGEISWQKKVDIQALGDTVRYDSAWSELDAYYGELTNSGALEH